MSILLTIYASLIVASSNRASSIHDLASLAHVRGTVEQWVAGGRVSLFACLIGNGATNGLV